MSDYALKFVTDLAPAKKFLVDGQEFSLLGVEHLSQEDEHEVTALFARFSILADELSATPNVEKGKGLAAKLTSTRLEILTKVTDMDKETAAKLHPAQQAKLIETIIEGIEAERDAES